MNKIKQISLIIFICIFSTDSWAQKTIAGSKNLPLEFNLILNNIYEYAPESIEKIKSQIYAIDYVSRNFSSEDLMILIKIEIYKTFLKNYDSPIKTPVDGKSLEIIKTAILKSNDSFMKWFLRALLKDAKDLISNPSYKEFLLQKNVNVKIEKIEYKKAEKKAELLQYWISKLNPNAEDYPDNLKKQLGLKMLEVLTNIQNSLQFISRESLEKSKLPFPKSDTDLKFISFKEAASPKLGEETKKNDSKSVDEILAPLTAEPAASGNEGKFPSPVQDDWTTEPNLPKPTNDAGWLEDF